jgi:hypothetical protein
MRPDEGGCEGCSDTRDFDARSHESSDDSSQSEGLGPPGPSAHAHPYYTSGPAGDIEEEPETNEPCGEDYEIADELLLAPSEVAEASARIVERVEPSPRGEFNGGVRAERIHPPPSRYSAAKPIASAA